LTMKVAGNPLIPVMVEEPDDTVVAWLEVVSEDVKGSAGADMARAIEPIPPRAARTEIARARRRKDLLSFEDSGGISLLLSASSLDGISRSLIVKIEEKIINYNS
jgi:hypothetical protein